MRLILEGCNKSGKSSIARGIAGEILNIYKVQHFKYPPKDTGELTPMQFQREVMEHAIDSIMRPYSHVIFDRFHLGEYVYPPLYRDYRADYIWEMEQKLPNNTILCLVTAKSETIRERFEESGSKDFVRVMDIGKVMAAFTGAFLLSKIKRKLLIYTDKLSTPEIIEKIKKFDSKETHQHLIFPHVEIIS